MRWSFQRRAVAPRPRRIVLWGRSLSVMDILMMLAVQKRLVLRTVFIFLLAGILYAALRPRLYDSTVSILAPPHLANQRPGVSFSDLWADLGSKDYEVFTEKNSPDYWESVLQRPQMQDRVIKREDLMAEYHTNSLWVAEILLGALTQVNKEGSGILDITVSDKDPRRAAEIAKAYAASIQQILLETADLDAATRIQFYKAQVAAERRLLEQAEQALVTEEFRSGLIAAGPQTQAVLGQIAGLRARQTELDLQLEQLRSRATDANPRVQRLKTEIAANNQALAQAEAMHSTAVADTGAAEVPKASEAYQDAKRQVDNHTAFYQRLGEQLQLAEFDKVRAAPIVEVIEPAVPAGQSGGIRGYWIVLASLLLGFIAGGVAAALRQVYWDYQLTPEGARTLANFKQSLQEHGFARSVP